LHESYVGLDAAGCRRPRRRRDAVAAAPDPNERRVVGGVLSCVAHSRPRGDRAARGGDPIAWPRRRHRHGLGSAGSRAHAWDRAHRRAGARSVAPPSVPPRRVRDCRWRHTACAMAVVDCPERCGVASGASRELWVVPRMVRRRIGARWLASDQWYRYAKPLRVRGARSPSRYRAWAAPVVDAARAIAPAMRWIRKNTRPHEAVIADADPLVYLFTDRRALPPVAFTADEYVSARSPIADAAALT